MAADKTNYFADVKTSEELEEQFGAIVLAANREREVEKSPEERKEDANRYQALRKDYFVRAYELDEE